MHVASKIVLLVLAAVLVLMLWTSCELWDQASARASTQWNCRVSEFVEVRDARQPWWTPDWGQTWRWVHDE